MRAAAVGVGLLLGVLCGAAQAEIQNLEQFLRDCETATHVSAALRGDGQLEVTQPSGALRRAAVMIVRPPTDLYVELSDPGFKALVLGGGEAHRVAAPAATVEAFAADALLGDSDFAREDLTPFRLARFAGWRISDENATEVTVMLFPSKSPYTLEVITFDREKRVPLKTLYYRDTLNNLVKLRRDTNYVAIGGTWLPQASAMETFQLRSHSTLTMHWTAVPSLPPALFDPAALPGPAGLTLLPPAAAATPWRGAPPTN